MEITPSQFQTKVTTARVFAIAGPAMVANLTTPLIGIVSTTAVGRLGDAALLGGVAMASVIFDCTFWLFGFLRMSTLAFTAQAIGAGERTELPAILMRGSPVASSLPTWIVDAEVAACGARAGMEPTPPCSPDDCGMLPVKFAPPPDAPNDAGGCCILPGATLAS